MGFNKGSSISLKEHKDRDSRWRGQDWEGLWREKERKESKGAGQTREGPQGDSFRNDNNQCLDQEEGGQVGTWRTSELQGRGAAGSPVVIGPLLVQAGPLVAAGTPLAEVAGPAPSR